MKKKNAFTLIELLAIIVILAIIAVITVPIILNIIENSRKGAAKDSAYGYKDSVNKYYVQQLPENNKLKLHGTYTVTNGTLTPSDENTTFGDEEITNFPVQVSGTVPSSGELTYSNNVLTEGWLVIGDYRVTFNQDGTVTTVKNSNSNNNTQYTVTFNYNNGSASTSETVSSGSTVTKPADPTKYDYTFDSWYSDEELLNIFNFTTPITSNTNLYAKWIQKWDKYYYLNESYDSSEATTFSDEWEIWMPYNTETKDKEICHILDGEIICIELGHTDDIICNNNSCTVASQSYLDTLKGIYEDKGGTCTAGLTYYYGEPEFTCVYPGGVYDTDGYMKYYIDNTKEIVLVGSDSIGCSISSYDDMTPYCSH